MSVSVNHLTKIYGRQRAVDDLSFEVREGSVTGFLGPNGAGKSTTMRMITGYIPPSEGSITVSDYDVQQNPLQVKRHIGYLPEHNPLYTDMYIFEYLEFVGRLYGLSGTDLDKRIREMIGVCGLEAEQKKKIGALSKGYRQRVGIAQAMLHDPQVLILDEPTSGLDPNQILEIRNLILQVGEAKTVLFSTHIMQEVQALCDRVIIINKGKIVADGPVEELKNMGAEENVISVAFEQPIDKQAIEQLEGITSVSDHGKGQYEVHAEKDVDIRNKLVQLSSEKQWPLVELRKTESSLESVFHKLTQQSESS